MYTERMCALLIALLALAPGGIAEEPNELLEQQLQYLKLVANAERHLAGGDHDVALEAADAAIALDVKHTVLKRLKLPGSSSTAHFLRACALAGENPAAALAALSDAATNGYTNTPRVERDPHLEPLRGLLGWSEVVRAFPDPDPTDAFAGKTVADAKFGNGLIFARNGNFPKLGERAPDFELSLRDGEGSVRLSSFRGKKPVVLVFGSFT